MKTFQVIGRVAAVHAGLVRLSADQARRRKHLLHDRGDGVYEVMAPIQFKHGERFGYDGEFPKAMATEVMPPEEVQAEPVAEKPVAPEMDPGDPAATTSVEVAPPVKAAIKSAGRKKK